MEVKITYHFSATIWQHTAPGGWYFVSLPEKMATEIRTHLKWQEEGWGRLKAAATVSGTTWDTAIWFDSKRKTYILPLKAEIRKQLKLKADQKVTVTLHI